LVWFVLVWVWVHVTWVWVGGTPRLPGNDRVLCKQPNTTPHNCTFELQGPALWQESERVPHETKYVTPGTANAADGQSVVARLCEQSAREQHDGMLTATQKKKNARRKKKSTTWILMRIDVARCSRATPRCYWIYQRRVQWQTYLPPARSISHTAATPQCHAGSSCKLAFAHSLSGPAARTPNCQFGPSSIRGTRNARSNARQASSVSGQECADRFGQEGLHTVIVPLPKGLGTQDRKVTTASSKLVSAHN
jgi:hypothetical protein